MGRTASVAVLWLVTCSACTQSTPSPAPNAISPNSPTEDAVANQTTQFSPVRPIGLGNATTYPTANSAGIATASPAAHPTGACLGITNGIPMSPQKAPAVVTVSTAGGGLCTGTFVGTNAVLTAAHCMEPQQSNGGPAATGLSVITASGQTITPTAVFFPAGAGLGDANYQMLERPRAPGLTAKLRASDHEDCAGGASCGDHFHNRWDRITNRPRLECHRYESKSSALLWHQPGSRGPGR